MQKRGFRSAKDLRLFLRWFFREHLRGLPPEFRIEAKVLSVRPPRAALFIPAHSEGNLIRVHQVDLLVEELAATGIELEVFYADDLGERDDPGP
ncbi:hypothetical protein [Thermosulfurimonas sp. F29]|uniref:hypothetical protein n=1 Tax=Thermosulfurimonas sp. F29 TaxID=2867247 RepID=UPI001C83DFD8|nr:hypothetical protein [Thermosulfurimonas sp. F29]MBX6422706.1 hypothetical protein [Thermosulfurimonas sp. F29]